MQTDPHTKALAGFLLPSGPRSIMKKTLQIAGILFVLLLAGRADVEAAKVKVWHHHRPGDHERADRKGVVLSDAGAFRLSRRFRSLAKLDATHVWAVVED